MAAAPGRFTLSHVLKIGGHDRSDEDRDPLLEKEFLRNFIQALLDEESRRNLFNYPGEDTSKVEKIPQKEFGILRGVLRKQP